MLLRYFSHRVEIGFLKKGYVFSRRFPGIIEKGGQTCCLLASSPSSSVAFAIELRCRQRFKL